MLINIISVFNFTGIQRRGANCTLKQENTRNRTFTYFQLQEAWNSLSDTVVTAPSVNAFRKQLNTVNLEKFLVVG